MKKNIIKVLSVLFAGLFLVTACSQRADTETKADEKKEEKDTKGANTGDQSVQENTEATNTGGEENEAGNE